MISPTDKQKNFLRLYQAYCDLTEVMPLFSYRILLEIWAGELSESGINTKQLLALGLGSKSSTQRALKFLLASGFISKCPCENDKRVGVFCLTDKAKTALGNLYNQIYSIVAD